MTLKIDLLPKQKESLKLISNSNYRYYALVGAVRSSKTTTAALAITYLMNKCPQGDLLIVGVSQATIIRNVINTMQKVFGDKHVKHNSGQQRVYFCGRTFWCIGATDDRAEAKIKGSTFAGAIIDEVTEIPENVFLVASQRLSLDGAAMVITTNTDSPHHWFKVNFLDRAEEISLKEINFFLEDNLSLPKKYIEDLKASHLGVAYKRFIEGLWAKAEGLIFPGFDEDCILKGQDPIDSHHKKYFVAVDCGYTNPCVFLKIGTDPYAKPRVWVEDEYYFNSKREGQHKTELELVEDCIQFSLKSGQTATMVYVDPSAPSFINCLNKYGKLHGIRAVAANNDVLPGISKIGNMFNLGRLKVHQKCVNLINEIYSYAWDENKSHRGIDDPKKEFDHAIDALRYFVNMYNEDKSEKLKEAVYTKEQLAWPFQDLIIAKA